MHQEQIAVQHAIHEKEENLNNKIKNGYKNAVTSDRMFNELDYSDIETLSKWGILSEEYLKLLGFEAKLDDMRKQDKVLKKAAAMFDRGEVYPDITFAAVNKKPILDYTHSVCEKAFDCLFKVRFDVGNKENKPSWIKPPEWMSHLKLSNNLEVCRKILIGFINTSFQSHMNQNKEEWSKDIGKKRGYPCRYTTIYINLIGKNINTFSLEDFKQILVDKILEQPRILQHQDVLDFLVELRKLEQLEVQLAKKNSKKEKYAIIQAQNIKLKQIRLELNDYIIDDNLNKNNLAVLIAESLEIINHSEDKSILEVHRYKASEKIKQTTKTAKEHNQISDRLKDLLEKIRKDIKEQARQALTLGVNAEFVKEVNKIAIDLTQLVVEQKQEEENYINQIMQQAEVIKEKFDVVTNIKQEITENPINQQKSPVKKQDEITKKGLAVFDSKENRQHEAANMAPITEQNKPIKNKPEAVYDKENLPPNSLIKPKWQKGIKQNDSAKKSPTTTPFSVQSMRHKQATSISRAPR